MRVTDPPIYELLFHWWDSFNEGMNRRKTKPETYQAPALTKGLEVLEFLSGQAEPHAVSELARALGKSRNEIYRMVIVLEQLGYLARTEGDRFSLTRKLFDVAMRAPPQGSRRSAWSSDSARVAA